MGAGQFRVSSDDDDRLDELLGLKRAVLQDPTATLPPLEATPTKREEAARGGRPVWLTTLEALSVVGLYAVMTIFTARLVGSQGTGATKIILTALGGIFEITKITLIIEAVKGKSAAIALVAGLFMAISFSGSALNMLSSWKATAAAAVSDPSEVARRELTVSLTALREQEKAESGRLASGSVEYRTDAENTRTSLAAIRAAIDAKAKELAALPAPKASGIQAENGFFGALPLPQEVKSGLELWFRVIMAAALELGGLAGIIFIAKRRAA